MTLIELKTAVDMLLAEGADDYTEVLVVDTDDNLYPAFKVEYEGNKDNPELPAVIITI